MILKDFLNKALDYDLDKRIVKDNGDGTSVDVVDVIQCTDEKGEEVVAIKFA